MMALSFLAPSGLAAKGMSAANKAKQAAMAFRKKTKKIPNMGKLSKKELEGGKKANLGDFKNIKHK